ncbi:MAG TPA: dihydrolipoamide acetyltransferase family protein [Archangium sp.]|uniref:dihydrolipoamide acetyltransferase family protein n=1 Tax=Archangium sp. TaxID=1872627 RepID=UPI002E30AB9B|nr:dihydrolipoamide acetyltransferase family protein [Archangium sp.]HEX5746279.1 dihydrolipoamide acetyltransferase family protein [Archangium sp.]
MGDFRMPSLGADMEAGTLVEWKVKRGDGVKRGDIVALVETQKGIIEVETFEAGTVEALLVEPGTKVPVGTVLAHLRGEGEPAVPEKPPAVEVSPPVGGHRPRASPAARAAAAKLGLDLAAVAGTGPGGAISLEDVERAARAAPAAPPASAPAVSDESRRLAMRRAIAAAMSRSKREIPHYYLDTRVDVGRALDWLRQENERLPLAERMLPVVLYLKAVGLAVRQFPELNGFWVDGAFRPSRAVHLGVVISLRQGGVMVPALHDVPDKPPGVLMRELGELIQRARRGTLRSSELADSTLTVTSLGEPGADRVFGVIFPPQVAIIGFGSAREVPWVVEGRCVPRPLVSVSLSADHRASDGHRGAAFLARVERLLQEPEKL